MTYSYQNALRSWAYAPNDALNIESAKKSSPEQVTQTSTLENEKQSPATATTAPVSVGTSDAATELSVDNSKKQRKEPAVPKRRVSATIFMKY